MRRRRMRIDLSIHQCINLYFIFCFHKVQKRKLLLTYEHEDDDDEKEFNMSIRMMMMRRSLI